jgi:two-component system catabolic regulation response regulator CreB
MARILLVEDELAIADAVAYALRAEGYAVEHRLLGSEGLRLLRAGGGEAPAFDLLILDIGLPDMTGLDVCRAVREFSAMPVIFLTARDSELDKVLGLELGADDYVVKPFSPRERVARGRARLRRPAPAPAPAAGWHAVGAFAHDAAGQRIRYGGAELALTRYEYRLLARLLARPGAILSRDRLMHEVWDDAPDTVDRTVDTHVKTLRAKLRAAQPDAADPIRTHRGLGYSLEA